MPMLDLEPAFQMHPALRTDQLLDCLLPLTHQPFEPPTYRSHQDRQEYGNRTSATAPPPDRALWAAPSRDGLHTPPEEMTGSNLNPPYPVKYGSRPEGHGFFPKPYGALQNPVSGIVPVNAVPSTKQNGEKQPGRQPSPRARKDLTAPPEQAQRRRSSSGAGDGGTSIVSYLQIPSTINNSKGSLAEFAAQVRNPVRLDRRGGMV